MKTKQAFLLTLFVVCTLTFLPMIVSGISVEDKAQIDVYGFSTLHGLKKVVPRLVVSPRTLEETMTVYIEGKRDELDIACESLKDKLQRGMLQSLNKAGIHTIFSGHLADDSTGYIGIDIQIRKAAEDISIYAFSVCIELNQLVQLVRDPQIRTNTTTWPNSVSSPNIVFVAGFDKLVQAITSEVTRLLDKFIEDYLAANPEQATNKKDTR